MNTFFNGLSCQPPSGSPSLLEGRTEREKITENIDFQNRHFLEVRYVKTNTCIFKVQTTRGQRMCITCSPEFGGEMCVSRKASGSQSVVPAPAASASPENLLELQVVRSQLNHISGSYDCCNS